MNSLGKFFIISGVIFIILGLGLLIFSKTKIPFLGKLPGDIFIQKENFSFYFPLASCLIISIILTLIFFIFSKK